jgi:hypothetical protein
LIHQLLGVTLVVAAVSLQHKSVTGAFVQAHQLGRRIPLLVCSRFFNSLSFGTPFRRSISPLSTSHGVGLSITTVPQLRIFYCMNGHQQD